MEENVPYRTHMGPLVQPGPVMVNVGIFTPTGSTDNLIAISSEGPNGTHIFMLPPDVAEQFAQAVLANARQAGTGLILPTQPLDIRHNPNGQGM